MSYGDPNGLLFMDDGPVWWESPDVTIPNDQAAVGSNTVTVRGHKKPGPSPSSVIRVEAFLCNPYVGPMIPGQTNVFKIGQVNIPATDLDTAGPAMGVTQTLTLTIPTPPANPTQTQKDDPLFAPSHRCLMARIFPSNFNPTPAAFTPATEQHEVQHNIEVVLVAMDMETMSKAAGAGAGHGGAMREDLLGPNADGLFEFRVDTTTRTKRAEKVTLRATWAATHTPEDRKRLTTILRRHHRGFKGLAEERPRRFAFSTEIPRGELPHFKGIKPNMPKVVKVTDRSKAAKGNLRYDAVIALQGAVAKGPRKLARLAFLADVRDMQVGFAQVFHLEQLGAKGNREGGLTVIFLRIR
jgi:hypothetical protein